MLHLYPFLNYFIKHFIHISFHLRLQILVFSGIYSNTCGFSKCRSHVSGWRYFHRGWLDIWDPPTGSQLTQVKWSQRETKLYFLNYFSCSEKGHHWSISTYVSSPLVIQRRSVNICQAPSMIQTVYEALGIQCRNKSKCGSHSLRALLGERDRWVK